MSLLTGFKTLILTYLQKQHSAPVFLPFVWVVLQGQLAICFSYLWKFHAALTWANWINFKAAFWNRHLSSPYDKTNTKEIDDSWSWCSKLPHAKRTKTNNSSCFVAQNWPKNAGGSSLMDVASREQSQPGLCEDWKVHTVDGRNHPPVDR